MINTQSFDNMNEDNPTQDEIYLVAYTDGSCRPSPGYGGYSVYAYTYKLSNKSKNTKHPSSLKHVFTSTGINIVKNETNIEVLDIYELIKCVNNKVTKNNYLELQAILSVFRKAYDIPNIKSIHIITDSRYATTSYYENLDKWLKEDWKGKGGTPIVHKTEWSTIDSFRKYFTSKGVNITLEWTKSHSDSYGNNLADTYAAIGSNSARIQLEADDKFVDCILEKTSTYNEYRDSFDNKDFLYYFKNFYFNNHILDDASYCFLSNGEDEYTRGKRVNTSIFVANVGYVPPLLNRIKQFYRNIKRNYITICCADLSLFDNKNILRLANLIDIKYLLIEDNKSGVNEYNILDEKGTFLRENIMQFPFIMEVRKLTDNLISVANKEDEHRLIIKDVTELFIKDNKLTLTNKDKFVDYTPYIEDLITFQQKVLVGIGYDMPSYLALKKIESDITKMEFIFKRDIDSNFYTLFTKISTTNRDIYSVNVLNKFLAYLPHVKN